MPGEDSGIAEGVSYVASESWRGRDSECDGSVRDDAYEWIVSSIWEDCGAESSGTASSGENEIGMWIVKSSASCGGHDTGAWDWVWA